MSGYGLWMAAAGMKVNEQKQAIQANNMANANTVGFKHDLAVVMERQVASQESPDGLSFAHPVLDKLPGGINVRPTYVSMAQGSMEPTGRPLDAAIDGDGFFVVGDGTSTRYTRNGEFTLNSQGELTLSSGNGRWKVQGDGGSPILIDPQLGSVNISGNGTIRQGTTIVAKLDLVTTEDMQSLKKVGENLFEGDETEMTPSTATVLGGTLEMANFDVMTGLTKMIEASRAYELNAKMVQLQDDISGQAASTIGRVG